MVEICKNEKFIQCKIFDVFLKCVLNYLMMYNFNIYVENLGWDLFG